MGLLRSALSAWKDAAVVSQGSWRLAEAAAAFKAQKLLAGSFAGWQDQSALRRRQMQLLSKAVDLHARKLLSGAFRSLVAVAHQARQDGLLQKKRQLL